MVWHIRRNLVHPPPSAFSWLQLVISSGKNLALERICAGTQMAQPGTVPLAFDQAWESSKSEKFSRIPKYVTEKRRIKTMKTVVTALLQELTESKIKATGNRRIYSR